MDLMIKEDNIIVMVIGSEKKKQFKDQIMYKLIETESKLWEKIGHKSAKIWPKFYFG